MSSSIDDQQERHFIGNLLSDEDAYTDSSNVHNFDDVISTPRLSSSSDALPNAGGIGPSPNLAFWPEPPPPYSSCPVASSHWTSVNHHHHQAPNVFAPPQSTGPFGQTPTATAVTRTDFYHSPYNARADWDNVTVHPVDAYMPPGLPYSSHSTLSMIKPVITPPGAIDTMKHHYQNMCHHHQQHIGPSPVDLRIYVRPPPLPLPSNYSGLEQSASLPVDQFSAQFVPEKDEIIQVQPNGSPSGNISSYFDSSGAVRKQKCVDQLLPPLGKSYRDVASKNDRAVSNPPNAPSLPPSVRSTSSNSAGAIELPLTGAKKLSVIQHRSADRNNTRGSTLLDTDEKNGDGKSSNLNEKNVSNMTKNGAKNDFKKIIHKKFKGVKSDNKTEVFPYDDGLIGNQAVDASSRFEVLQSLGVHTSNVSLHSNLSPRRSLSQAELFNDTSDKSTKIRQIVEEDADLVDNEKTVKREMWFDEREYENESGKKIIVSAERRFPKKGIISRQELNSASIFDAPRGGRKQRCSVKKHQNSITDYISFVIALVLSIARFCIQWIANLLIDIFFQLWDVTHYTMVVVYKSIIFGLQRFWHDTLKRMRLIWRSICRLSLRNILIKRESEAYEWGLSENIQLPATGEEAMERILRCRGGDAYAVLGLRADCHDDDIRRYYKRQAVLVHPDKNRLSGSDEAFKILSRAFEAVGTTDARIKYNIANLHKNPLHKEMEELWERLREKMDTARNTMYCDCGSKHTRVPMENIRSSEARYCRKCKIRHPAKHNDIWAETRFMGFLWIYYACLDGVVYDISQWASCSSNHLKHMKANSHAVQYRLVTTSGPPSNKSNKLKQKRTRQLEKDFEDMCCLNQQDFGDFDDGSDCGCSIPMDYFDSGIAASQQASYRPPERNPCNEDRPRRAGRRRRLR